MSRIGKQPILIPDGVDVSVEGLLVKIKGGKGELVESFSDSINMEKKETAIKVFPKNEDKLTKSKWGLTRTLINNMVIGVTEGFVKSLVINGVGYRALVDSNILSLQLGFSHDIKIAIPEDIQVECPKPTEINIKGINKQRVGQFASEIRSIRKPEPYKGKGISYVGEYIRRKEGKKK